MAVVLAVCSAPASAHLLSAGLLGVVVDAKSLKWIVSLRETDLAEFDDNHDGQIDIGEFRRHDKAMRQKIRRGIDIRFAAKGKRLEREDFFMSGESLIFQQLYRFEQSPTHLSCQAHFGEWQGVLRVGNHRQAFQLPRGVVKPFALPPRDRPQAANLPSIAFFST